LSWEFYLTKVISYNLRKHAAIGELSALATRYEPDFICLQECDALNIPAEVGALHLADSTKRNRLGLAIYYRRDRYQAIKSESFSLKKSLHDRLASPAHERLIGTRLLDLETQRELVVASFHAAPLTATNSLRRNQIKAAHGLLRDLGPGLPTLMVGDYNYPLFRDRLGTQMRDSGYDITLSDSRTYTRYVVFRGHFDLATSFDLDINSVETLPQGTSDHMPILVNASYRAAKVPAAAS
jgi:endonuclease/exonuclease/phosphatase family metal-dependent hydrolase